MNYIKYPATVKMLTQELIRACDDYFGRRTNEEELRHIVRFWAKNAGDMLFCGPSGFNATITQRVGKKRLKLVEAMLEGFQTQMLI